MPQLPVLGPSKGENAAFLVDHDRVPPPTSYPDNMVAFQLCDLDRQPPALPQPVPQQQSSAEMQPR